MKNAFIFLLTFLFLETQFVYAASLPSGENIISVDGASNAALIQNEFITSFPQVDAISIQRL